MQLETAFREVHFRVADVKNASSGYKICTQMLLHFALLVEEKHFNTKYIVAKESHFTEDRIDRRAYIFETLK